MTHILGMRGTGDWATDQRPKSWREMILYLYPQGKSPLTAMLSKFGKEKVTDPEFNWWTKTVEAAAGAVTKVYTDVNMAVAYVSGGTVGQVVYVKIAEALADQIRAGHQVLLRDASDSTVDVNGKVVSVTKNGANSSLAVRLLEADDNSSSNTLANCDRLIVIGNINAEGATMPAAISKNPTKVYNYTQIFRTPLDITRTARRTKLRTGDQYQQLKMEALEMHGIEMEFNTLFGVMTERTGDNGQKERTTMGIIPFVRANASGNIDDFRLNASYAGTTWLASGEAYLDTMLEQLARYASIGNMVWLCGSGAIKGLNDLAKNAGMTNITPETMAYGLRVSKWLTPFGDMNLMTHPLLSQESTTRNMIVGVTPSSMKFRYVDDTTFFAEGEQQNTGHNRVDGTKEEYLTEAGYEYQHAEQFMILDGIGQNSAV